MRRETRWEVTDFPILVDLHLLTQILTSGSVHTVMMLFTLFTIFRILKTLLLRIAFRRRNGSPFAKIASRVVTG